MNIRTFIALELSDEAKKEMSRVEEILKKTDADVKWVIPEAIHITLKFLGNIRKENVLSVNENLKSVAFKTSPFDITLGDIGVFPGWDRPRVLWIGIDEGCRPLEKLAGSVRAAMSGEGESEEELSISPHITIGRVKSGRNKAGLQDESTSIKVVPALVHISRLVFFESLLTKEGAVHTVLSAWDLTG
ncbi:MAG: RNA 2',3'-cyclic phosphodiesterase [Candidatus Omnitrophica bacterium]|nr:RNA 2',3'-cyclic phosphodiesterase [Candidatus Omnitrophota bacterium]MBU1128655.1 RNA 2',3'-cyclic phosphodiesterase [Candidatus Omnitrophota bacterium]MBU1783932.1 RNA 2',3'-cyclic phosphodiesterase [Candidatus Omnitrophota bacterium]MBU1852215.1 RNA 2',3'-cyclic phosphodiesterase [Candidatus Omnitrophota bacterium]